MIIPVVLAGGSGTRLWPLSRKHFPKQFFPMINGRTLFQETCRRLNRFDKIGPPLVVCNEVHRFLVAEQLTQVGIEPSGIILEPMGRNTAPAAALAAHFAKTCDADPTLLVLPADHHIEDAEALYKAIDIAHTAAQEARLTTFGIVPAYPEVGYGYIRRGDPLKPGKTDQIFKIGEFVEKPDLETAKAYLSDGGYYWNSGMFCFRAEVFLEELERMRPDIAEVCKTAMESGAPDLVFYRPEEKVFGSCPSDSIDYAIMEKTERGAVIPLDAGWNDVGSWRSLWSIKPKGNSGNVAIGDVVHQDVHDCYLHATGRLLAVVGLRDHVVVETPDAVMVAPSERSQDVKLLVNALKSEKRPEALDHKQVYRPWGSSETLDQGDRFQIKRITVKPGARLTTQKHFHRAEHWIVLKGTARVTIGDRSFVLTEDESKYIQIGQAHRLENPGKIPLELIEVRTGSYFGEDDIVRADTAEEKNNGDH